MLPLGGVVMPTHFQWWGRLAHSLGYHMVQRCRTPQTAGCCWLKRWPLSAWKCCSRCRTPEGTNLDQSWFGTGCWDRTQTGRWTCRSLSPPLWNCSCVLWSPVSCFPVWGTGSRTPLPAGASWWSDPHCCRLWWFHSWKWGCRHLPAELKGFIFSPHTANERKKRVMKRTTLRYLDLSAASVEGDDGEEVTSVGVDSAGGVWGVIELEMILMISKEFRFFNLYCHCGLTADHVGFNYRTKVYF